MKTNRTLILALGVATFLLATNIVVYIFHAQPAAAAKETDLIGKYQISSWAAQTGSYAGYSGYYIIDTTTGRVVDQKQDKYGGVK